MIHKTDEEKAVLASRFLLVEIRRKLKHRQEKMQNNAIPASAVAWTVRRRLFPSSDTASFKSFADSELQRIALRNKTQWNFDFEKEVPANLPNAKYIWEKIERIHLPEQQEVVAAPSSLDHSGESSTPVSSTTTSAVPKKQQTKITDFYSGKRRREGGSASASRSAKFLKSNDLPSDNVENDLEQASAAIL